MVDRPRIPPVVDLIGKPFRLGGRGPEAYDCYGLILELGNRMGVVFPDYSSPATHLKISDCIEEMMPFWTPCEQEVGAVATIRIGDRISHVGMVLPGEKLIHAWNRAGGVCIEPLTNWERRITGYYKFTHEPV